MSAVPAAEPPLYVDLDGTLIATDLLHETFVAAVKRSPWVAVQCPVWLAAGRPRLKQELARRGEVDVATLPYREEVLQFLREEKARGRRIVLATAAWEGLAQAVAAHLGLFDEVIATNAERNFKGEAKGRHFVEACGAGAFDYLGDSHADLAIWRDARHAYVVDSGGTLAARIPEGVTVGRRFDARAAGSRWGAALDALRPHQWAKNFLVFVPLIAAHRVADPAALVAAFQALLAFCLAASSAYLLNDLSDLAADRAHPRKRRRPLASGRLSIPAGLVLAAACRVGAAVTASCLPRGFGISLAAYYALTVLYSFTLRRIAMVDVIVLAALYTLRIVAGAFAIAVPLSFWLLGLSMFLFFSLALVKRYAELAALRESGIVAAPGRGYAGRDIDIVLAVGVASAMVSALVLALYMNSDSVKLLYSRPDVLWLTCPLLLFWVCRVWLLAARGEMNEDPVLFAVRDRASYFVAAAALALIWLAT